jgi:hypothetical protein
MFLFLNLQSERKMIKGTKLLLLIYFITGAVSFAQTLSNQVMVPAANIVTKSSVNYRQTIGETAVEIVNRGNYVLTQGFQQPGMLIKDPVIYKGNGVNVYPNPVNEYIEIKLFGESARKFKIDLINFAGRVIKTGTIEFFDAYFYIQRWEAGEFIPGFYIVRVVSDDGVINRSFKIEKI